MGDDDIDLYGGLIHEDLSGQTNTLSYVEVFPYLI